MQKKISVEIPFYGEENSPLNNPYKKRIFSKIFNYTCARIAYNFPIRRVRVLLHKWRGVHIGKNVNISRQITIDLAYPEFVYIGDNVAVNLGTVVLAHTNPMQHFEGVIPSLASTVIIKDGAMIGINSTILPGVVIGKNAIVSAGAVVNRDVPDNTITYGRKYKKDFCFQKLINN